MDLDLLHHLPLNIPQVNAQSTDSALQTTLATDDLTLPHPQLHRRDFVLVPLSQVLQADWNVDIPRYLRNCPALIM